MFEKFNLAAQCDVGKILAESYVTQILISLHQFAAKFNYGREYSENEVVDYENLEG